MTGELTYRGVKIDDRGPAFPSFRFGAWVPGKRGLLRADKFSEITRQIDLALDSK